MEPMMTPEQADDPDDAVVRLETALEQIARLAGQPAPSRHNIDTALKDHSTADHVSGDIADHDTPEEPLVPAEEIATRLDDLIDRLRVAPEQQGRLIGEQRIHAMPQVTLRINGYAYTVGCKDGEEEHLAAMGAELEGRIESVRVGAGQSGESRMLVMAGLLMADELFELRQKLAAAEARSQAEGAARLGRRLNKVAKRAEEIAAGLEHP